MASSSRLPKIKWEFSLHNITALLDKLGKCQYFTTLNLASGYLQIEMRVEDIPKTAFNTENAHFEYYFDTFQNEKFSFYKPILK